MKTIFALALFIFYIDGRACNHVWNSTESIGGYPPLTEYLNFTSSLYGALFYNGSIDNLCTCTHCNFDQVKGWLLSDENQLRISLGTEVKMCFVIDLSHYYRNDWEYWALTNYRPMRMKVNYPTFNRSHIAWNDTGDGQREGWIRFYVDEIDNTGRMLLYWYNLHEYRKSFFPNVNISTKLFADWIPNESLYPDKTLDDYKCAYYDQMDQLLHFDPCDNDVPKVGVFQVKEQMIPTWSLKLDYTGYHYVGRYDNLYFGYEQPFDDYVYDGPMLDPIAKPADSEYLHQELFLSFVILLTSLMLLASLHFFIYISLQLSKRPWIFS